MATLFAGKMNFITLVPDGYYTNKENKQVNMYKVVLQDREDLQLHNFKFSEMKANLVEQAKELKPMELVTVLLSMEYDRFKEGKGNTTKISIRELYPVQELKGK